MASHRQSKNPTRAAAATLVGLTAGTVALVPAAANAAPAQTVKQVQAEVNTLNAQAETATQQYDAAQESYAQLQQKVNSLQGQIVTDTTELHTLQKAMGLQAGAQYQENGISPTLQLALSVTPDSYLAQASVDNENDQQDAARYKELNAMQAQLKQDIATAASLLAEEQAAVKTLSTNKNTINSELSQKQSLLNSLNSQQRAEVENGTDGNAQLKFNGPLPAVSGRAGVAVAYAESKVGDEYVTGGNGPTQFDCSGLTQESWKAAGVYIPRTSYEQYSSLTHIPLSDLEPGDLVFFYPGPSGPNHVSIYIGDGEIIHAPRPGEKVQYASLYGSDMPIVGAARV